MILAIFALTVVAAMLTGVILLLAQRLQTAMLSVIPGVMLFVILGAMLYASLANGARRFHDRGKSAWWLLLVYGPGLVSLGALMSLGPDPKHHALSDVARVFTLPFTIWWLVELGMLKGTVGPNKYGGDPMGPLPTPEEFAG